MPDDSQPAIQAPARRVELPETLPDLRYLCFMILQPRGELVLAFVVLTKAKGVFGELPKTPLTSRTLGLLPHSGMIPKSSARANRTAKTTMNTIRRTSRRRATSR